MKTTIFWSNNAQIRVFAITGIMKIGLDAHQNVGSMDLEKKTFSGQAASASEKSIRLSELHARGESGLQESRRLDGGFHAPDFSPLPQIRVKGGSAANRQHVFDIMTVIFRTHEMGVSNKSGFSLKLRQALQYAFPKADHTTFKKALSAETLPLPPNITIVDSKKILGLSVAYSRDLGGTLFIDKDTLDRDIGEAFVSILHGFGRHLLSNAETEADEETLGEAFADALLPNMPSRLKKKSVASGPGDRDRQDPQNTIPAQIEVPKIQEEGDGQPGQVVTQRAAPSYQNDDGYGQRSDRKITVNKGNRRKTGKRSILNPRKISIRSNAKSNELVAVYQSQEGHDGQPEIGGQGSENFEIIEVNGLHFLRLRRKVNRDFNRFNSITIYWRFRNEGSCNQVSQRVEIKILQEGEENDYTRVWNFLSEFFSSMIVVEGGLSAISRALDELDKSFSESSRPEVLQAELGRQTSIMSFLIRIRPRV